MSLSYVNKCGFLHVHDKSSLPRSTSVWKRMCIASLIIIEQDKYDSCSIERNVKEFTIRNLEIEGCVCKWFCILHESWIKCWKQIHWYSAVAVVSFQSIAVFLLCRYCVKHATAPGPRCNWSETSSFSFDLYKVLSHGEQVMRAKVELREAGKK